MNDIILNTQTRYDQVAEEYAEKFKDEMDDKPFDRDCLDRLAREVGNFGPICDLGCGPGQNRLQTMGVNFYRYIPYGPSDYASTRTQSPHLDC